MLGLLLLLGCIVCVTVVDRDIALLIVCEEDVAGDEAYPATETTNRIITKTPQSAVLFLALPFMRLTVPIGQYKQ